MNKPTLGQEPFITLQVTPKEMIALGSAIIGYIRLVEQTVPPCKERAEVIAVLLAFQKRFVDSLPLER